MVLTRGRAVLAQAAELSLHAGIGIEADARGKPERLCRYVSRPAVAEERLALTQRGDVRLQLKTAYRDGSTHVILEPLDSLARLAVVRRRTSLRRLEIAGRSMPIPDRAASAVLAVLLPERATWRRDCA
jgi:hypothetical protein